MDRLSLGRSQCPDWSQRIVGVDTFTAPECGQEERTSQSRTGAGDSENDASFMQHFIKNGNACSPKDLLSMALSLSKKGRFHYKMIHL